MVEENKHADKQTNERLDIKYFPYAYTHKHLKMNYKFEKMLIIKQLFSSKCIEKKPGFCFNRNT